MAMKWDDALAALAAERYPRLLGRAMLLTGDRAAAEDLVQEALVATLTRRRNFDSLAQAEQYVRRAIATRFVDGLRSAAASRRREVRAFDDTVVPDPASGAGGAIDLAAALRSLPPRTRACVTLRYLEDMSIRETAAALRLSEGAVKRYVHDGVRALNMRLGTTDDADASPTVSVEAKGGAR